MQKPDDTREWLRLAGEDLALAESRVPGVGFGLLCFHAQQAAEKAVKAVLASRGVAFPYVHDIGRLVDLARTAGVTVPAEVAEADLLTDYSTLGRYPGSSEIAAGDHQNAIVTARAVLAWATQILLERGSDSRR